jgi:mRNA interferase MazF
LVLTRSTVLDVRSLVTVAEITTSIRGLGVEVHIDGEEAGLDRESVINCDGIHTLDQAKLSGPIGEAGDETMGMVCSAIRYALDCA